MHENNNCFLFLDSVTISLWQFLPYYYSLIVVIAALSGWTAIFGHGSAISILGLITSLYAINSNSVCLILFNHSHFWEQMIYQACLLKYSSAEKMINGCISGYVYVYTKVTCEYERTLYYILTSFMFSFSSPIPCDAGMQRMHIVFTIILYKKLFLVKMCRFILELWCPSVHCLSGWYVHAIIHLRKHQC